MKTPKQKSLKTLEKEVSEFNAKHKPGDLVNIKNDSGEILTRKVLHEAEVLSGHSAVGWFEGIRGCYLLDRVID